MDGNGRDGRRCDVEPKDIEGLLSPIVGEAGLELVEVEHKAALLRVVVDGPGADLDRLAEVTQAVSSALDAADAVPGGRYTLEVTTPGLERPLRTPQHFARAVGEQVLVRLVPGVEGDRRVRGRLVAADEDGIIVEEAGPEAGGRRISYSEVERARTVFEWGAPSGDVHRPARAQRAATGRR
jgi:ribosome maturation factor RimP